MPRIAVDVDAFVEDLFTEFGLAAGRGKRTTTFLSTARVETKRKKPEQIGNGLRFENRRIHAGFEHARISRFDGFANRFVCDAGGIEFRHVEMVPQKVAGAAS